MGFQVMQGSCSLYIRISPKIIIRAGVKLSKVKVYKSFDHNKTHKRPTIKEIVQPCYFGTWYQEIYLQPTFPISENRADCDFPSWLNPCR